MHISEICSTFAPSFQNHVGMKIFFGCFLVFAALLTGCADKQSVLQEVAPFHYVTVNGRSTKTNLALVQTPDTWQIGITSRHADSLTYFVCNDTLHLYMPADVRYHYEITLCAPEFRSVEACLLNTLYTPDTLLQDTMMVQATLVNTMRLNVHVEQLRTIHRCNKNAYLAGTADIAYLGNAFADVDLDASCLKTKDLHLCMGEGKVKVDVSDHFWIHDSFQSKITYVGSPVIEECNLRWSILSNAFFFQ